MSIVNDFTVDVPAVPLEVIDGKPALQLPGEGLLLSDFARVLGELVSSAGVFARQGCAFTLDHKGQKLEAVTPTWLRTWIEDHVVPYKVKVSKNGITVKIKQSITEDVAKAVNGSKQFLEELPKVERFHPCPMPVERPDGMIELLATGMDIPSTTFTADPGFEPSLVPLAQATATIRNLLSEFCWSDDGGRSMAVHVAAMLTVFAGGILPRGTVVPVFIYMANAEGAGKTLLASLAGIPYAEPPPAEAAPKQEEEWQKKLLALTASGRRLVLLDNLKGHLNSPSLEAYVTSPTFTGRILGVTKEFTGDAGATILITGNKLTISADMRRRALLVELFEPELRAEDRKFKRILDAETVRAMCPAVVSALWSIVHAWDQAGRPACSHSNASFQRWARTIAGMVEFAGFGSPLAPAEIEGMGDTDTADFAELVKSMEPGKRYTFEEIVTMADEGGLFEWILVDRDKEDRLSRGGRKRLSSLLGRYDRRRVTTTGHFALDGKGHSRRYILHDRHDTHDATPTMKNDHFSKGVEHHVNHAHHAPPGESPGDFSEEKPTPAKEPAAPTHAPVNQQTEAGSPVPSIQTTSGTSTGVTSAEDQWLTVLAKVIEREPLASHWLGDWRQVTMDGNVLRLALPSNHKHTALSALGPAHAALIVKLWSELFGQVIEVRLEATGEPLPQRIEETFAPANLEQDAGINKAIEEFADGLLHPDHFDPEVEAIIQASAEAFYDQRISSR